MKDVSPGKFKIIKWCIITLVVYSLVLFLLYYGDFFRNLKKEALLKQLSLPNDSRSTLMADEKYYDFLQYTDSYNWSIIKFSDYLDNRDKISATVKSNSVWHTEQISQNAIQSLTNALPGDGRGFQTLIPSLSTSYDAWYFQSPTGSSTKTDTPATMEELISYCEGTSIYSYTVALFDKEDGCLWYFQLN